mmetsp:Transcript_22054/g.40514  ORF Transcript_22054/g.40514 Transcript_22054/m.40514 type:complete len:309 (+) Transcript_22054:497-1423(+)
MRSSEKATVCVHARNSSKSISPLPSESVTRQTSVIMRCGISLVSFMCKRLFTASRNSARESTPRFSLSKPLNSSRRSFTSDTGKLYLRAMRIGSTAAIAFAAGFDGVEGLCISFNLSQPRPFPPPLLLKREARSLVLDGDRASLLVPSSASEVVSGALSWLWRPRSIRAAALRAAEDLAKLLGVEPGAAGFGVSSGAELASSGTPLSNLAVNEVRCRCGCGPTPSPSVPLPSKIWPGSSSWIVAWRSSYGLLLESKPALNFLNVLDKRAAFFHLDEPGNGVPLPDCENKEDRPSGVYAVPRRPETRPL